MRLLFHGFGGTSAGFRLFFSWFDLQTEAIIVLKLLLQSKSIAIAHNGQLRSSIIILTATVNK